MTHHIYVSVTSHDGDEVNFHRYFKTTDGLWTEGKKMLRDAIDSVHGPHVISEDLEREEQGF